MALPTASAKSAVLVFDLGGVLCEFSTERRLAALGEACGLPPHEVKQLLDDSRLIHLADRGELDRDSEYRLATSVLGLGCDYPTYRGLWCTALQPDKRMIEIAREVHERHRTAILTNNGPVLLDALRHELDAVGEHFDDLFVSAMFGAIKPAEAVFRGVERTLGVRPEQLLLIDDSPANVVGAERCGWRGIHFTAADRLREDLRVALAI
jgi:putative hydrolase of the HAD superfamily